jgi:hypothetical protein
MFNFGNFINSRTCIRDIRRGTSRLKMNKDNAAITNIIQVRVGIVKLAARMIPKRKAAESQVRGIWAMGQ